MTRTTKRILTVLGALGAIGVVGTLGYGIGRAAARPSAPRYPDPHGLEPAPLRPEPAPPGAPPPGPLATRLGALLAELDDADLQSARNAMPGHWWAYIGAATQMPDDEGFRFAMQPVAVDMWIWTPEQREQLQADLVASLGLTRALELRGILQDAGVL
ncbi:MAG: hypothetical protein K0U16_07440 [Gammaproteobacteria bacterium]|nr:hypothetical protein [Gammaproteobacteria bacterium]